MANATSTQLQELYVAYFGRAADPTGLDYWKEKGITTAAFAANMYAQPEFKSAYGSLTTESQVNQIYKNLFDRAADVTGLTYWTQQIKLGNLQLAEIANHLIWAAQNNSGSADDKTALTNRTNAAVAYTAKIKETTAAILAFQPLHNGLGTEDFSAGLNITEAVSYLSGIDKDTVYTAAGVATSVAKITDNGIPSPNAKTYTLTSNTDNLSGSTGKDVYQGVFDASGTGTGTTATAGDSMVGGTGVDTFNLSITGAHTDAIGITGINADVEKILVSNYNTDTDQAHTHTFDASLSDGVTTVGLSASNDNGDTLFTNLKAIANAEMVNGSGDLSVSHVNAAVAGTADSMTLTVSGVTEGGTVPSFTETAASGGVETLNVVSKGSANTVNLSSGNNTVTTVNISGDQNLTTGISANVLDKIDASSFTGNLDVSYNVARDLTVTGGSGDDTITFGSTNTMTKGDVIDGGAGTDVLEIADDITAVTALSNVTNVETLKITGDYDVTIADDANVMNFDFTSTSQNILTLNAGVSAAASVTFGITGADQVKNLANVGLTVKGNHDAIDASTLITGGSGTDTIELEGNEVAENDDINIAAGNITKVEKILIVDGGDATTGTESATNKLSGDDVWLTTGNYATALEVDASALDAANKDNDNDGDIDSSDSSEEKLVFDGSSATGVLTVTGGAGADTITSGTKDDIIDGGAGADTITSTGGKDNIKGGAGDDKFIFTTTLTKDDVVDGGAGTDTLSVTSLDAANLAGVTNVETLAFTGSTNLSKDLSFDTLDLTDGSSNDSVTFATGYTKASTVKVDAGDSAINGAKITMAVSGTAADFETADSTIITGSSSTTNDSITITADGSTVDTRSLITNVDSITVVDGGDATTGSTKLSGSDFTINLTSYGTALTLDASALDFSNKDNDADGDVDKNDSSHEILTITGASSKALTVTGGAGHDVIVGSSDSAAGDTLKGGAGDDGFSMGAGNLTYLDTIDGGAGTDTITVTQDVSDVDFMNVTNAEVLTIDEGATSTNVLSAYFNLSGITKVNLDPDHVSTISASGTTTNVTYVSGGTNNEAITAGLGDDTFSFSGTNRLDVDDDIDGGAGTDTIEVDNSGGAATVELGLGGSKNIEKLVVKNANGGDTVGAEDADAISITVNGESTGGIETDNSTDNADVQITIDASVVTDSNDTTTIDVSTIADPDYSFVIKGAASADGITGSGTVDTISGNDGADTIDAGAGDDIVDGGAGADSITGGTGQDTLTGGAGNDTFKYALGSSQATNAKPDTITDFSSGNDEIRISFTAAAAATTYDFTDQGTATDASSSIEKLSSVAGQYLFNTTNSAIVLDTDGNGLLQAGDFRVDLTGVTALADADIAFDITTLTTADTVTTGAGNDTVKSQAAADVITTGKGDDKVTLAHTAANTGNIRGGEGTDTLIVTHADSEISGITTFDGFEKIEIAEAKALIVSPAQLNAFNAIAGFSVSGVAGSANEPIVVTTAAGSAQSANASAITFSADSNIILTGNDNVDTLTAGSGDDYLDGAAGGDIDILTGGAGNDTYNLTDLSAVDKIVEGNSGGTDTFIVDVDASSLGTTFSVGTTLGGVIAGNLTNIEQIVFGNDDDATMTGAQLTGKTIAFNTVSGLAASLITVTGTDSAIDTLDLSSITVAAVTYTGSDGDTKTGIAFNSGDDKIIVNQGTSADVLTLNNSISEVIDVDAGDSATDGYDVVTNFAVAADALDLATSTIANADDSGALTALNDLDYVNIAADGLADFEDATGGGGLAVAITTTALRDEAILDLNTKLGGTTKTVVFTGIIDSVAYSWIYQGAADATDVVVQLTGVTATGLSTSAQNTDIVLV